MSESLIVFARVGKISIAITLTVMLGGHWAFLQTVAWTAMFANNLQSRSFHDAVVRTFDGKHPCCLCKAIAAAKKSEKKNEFTVQMQKFEFPPAEENFVLIAPSQHHFFSFKNSFADSLTQKPPTPPPRAV